MQKQLVSFTDLNTIGVATVSSTAVVPGYFFNNNGETEEISFSLNTTSTSILDLYRTYVSDTTAFLPYKGLVLKPSVGVTFARPDGHSVTTEAGTWKLGSTSVGYWNEFHDRELVTNEFGSLPPLGIYYFVADTTSGTVNGFFVDHFGTRTGSAFSYTLGISTAANFEDMYGEALPIDAVGAVIDTDQDMVFDATREDVSTAKSNLVTNKANHPTVSSGSSITYGKVI